MKNKFEKETKAGERKTPMPAPKIFKDKKKEAARKQCRTKIFQNTGVEGRIF